MASSAPPDSISQLRLMEAKTALTEAIQALNDPKNCQKMSAARLGSDRSDTAVDGQRRPPQLDAVRHMQHVFPIATQIVIEVIGNHGFAATGEGLIEFTLAVRQLERFDEDIKRLNTQLKRQLLPNLPTVCRNKSSVV